MSSKTSREEIINQQWEVCIELSLRHINVDKSLPYFLFKRIKCEGYNLKSYFETSSLVFFSLYALTSPFQNRMVLKDFFPFDLFFTRIIVISLPPLYKRCTLNIYCFVDKLHCICDTSVNTGIPYNRAIFVSPRNNSNNNSLSIIHVRQRT